MSSLPVPFTMMSIVVSLSGDVPHAAVVPAATVTVIPVLIVIESPLTGGPEPPHVAVLAQFPVTLAVYAATAYLLRSTVQTVAHIIGVCHWTVVPRGDTGAVGLSANSTE